eukprot:jgi/Psemu1/31900/gm1.31900_g
MTRDAATTNSLLGIMKTDNKPTLPPPPHPHPPSPLQIDQENETSDDDNNNNGIDAGANNNTSNNNEDMEMKSQPARVSLEPTPTNWIQNPYAKQYNNNNNNNNNKSSQHQTKKQKQEQKGEEEKESEREEEEKQAAKPEEQDEEINDEGISSKAKAADDYLHQSKTLVDQAMKIWTTSIKNFVNGDVLNFKSHRTYSWQLFSAFRAQGVPYNKGVFNHKGGYKAAFDEFVEEKFKKVTDDGIYNPHEEMLDLLKLMVMELGRQFGVRGKDELSHQLSLNNAEVSTNYPMVVEDTNNSNCIVKLIFYYRDHCCPDQVRFFCHVNHLRGKTANYVFKPKSPGGADTIWKWVRDFAEHTKSSHPYIHQNSKTQKTVQGVLCSGLHKEQQPEKKMVVNNNSNNSSNNSSNNKPPAPSTKQVVVINVDQQNKENIPVPQDRAPAKEVQKRKKDSKELKKEKRKQRTKLQDAEEDVAKLTIDLKASNNINKTLTNEADRLHHLEQRLEEQKNLHQKELLQQQLKADAKIAKLKDRYAKDLEDAKKTATKEAADEFYKMERRNQKGRMEADHRNQVVLAENKIKNEQRLRDIELKGKQNEINQLHQQMNQNQCAIM